MKNLIFAALFLLGCTRAVAWEYCDEPPEEPQPNGYCEVDEDCADTDFCLAEWCDGPECRTWQRCMLRSLPGDGCERDGHCPQGTSCTMLDDAKRGTCEPSA